MRGPMSGQISSQTLSERCAEHPVALDADGRQIRIVAEERELRSPQHPHRVARIEHHAHDRLQRLRPRRRGTERRTPTSRCSACARPSRRRRARKCRAGSPICAISRPSVDLSMPSIGSADAITMFQRWKNRPFPACTAASESSKAACATPRWKLNSELVRSRRSDRMRSLRHDSFRVTDAFPG